VAPKQTLVAFNQPDPAGTRTSFQFSIMAVIEANPTYFNKDVFVTIVAFDQVPMLQNSF
jgi:hypothetical protein